MGEGSSKKGYIMNLGAQILLASVGGAALILAVGLFRNTILNVIMAPLLGFPIALVPAHLTDELWLSRLMWIIASLAAFTMLRTIQAAPALDFRRPLIGAQRRQAARRAVASEVKRLRFEVER